MKPFLIVGAVLALGSYIVLSSQEEAQTASQDPVKQVRIDAGGAKFVPTRPQTRTGPSQKNKPVPRGAVSLTKSSKPPASGLALSDLKARQKAERSGYVTQRNGSASLPRHNDVGRMDAMIVD